MEQELRRPFLLLALILIVVVVLIELGAAAFIETAPDPEQARQRLIQSESFRDLQPADQVRTLEAVQNQAASDDGPPGIGIPYLALVDGVLAYTLLLMTLALIVPERVQGKVQGIVTLILSFLLVIAGIMLAILAFVKLILMVTLFLAVPFGTIAYLAVFGGFDTGGAAVVLSLIMVLKLVTSGSLIVAQQRFLLNKGLVLMVLTSLLCTIIVSFLHGIVPSVLVSITDALAALVVGIIGVIWAIVVLIGSIFSIVATIAAGD